MEFWLIQDNEKLQLPVPPSDYQVDKGMNNTSLIVENIGEINFLGRPKLITISISSFFPAQEYSFCQYSGVPKPYQCVELVEKWKDNGKPIRIIITETKVNMLCSIEDFKYGEKDGTRDVYFTLDLKEYKILSTSSQGSSSSTNVSTRATTYTTPTIYTVKRGDTLYSIAKTQYGDGSKYTLIAQNNNILNPNLIQVGQVLQL
jgi:nucleoid-associated protein YgaU